MTIQQVKIGPNFFSKVKNDYRDWKWAIVREFLQNSCDARGTTKIDITSCVSGEYVVLTVANNGEPMDRNTIENKLLALGESGKDFDGTVGGFGIAKSVLYFCHDSYSIESGNYLVVGSGGSCDISETDESYDGTKSTIKIKGDIELCCSLLKNFLEWIDMAQKPGITFTINDQVHKATMAKGYRRRELAWGTIYTNRSFINRLIVRIDGTPMFHMYTSIDKCVVIELTSSKVLTSNRDALCSTHRYELDEFVRELTVDKQSALRDNSPRYIHWKGDQLQHLASSAKINQTMEQIISAAYATLPTAAGVEPEENSVTIGIDHVTPLNYVGVSDKEIVEEVRSCNIGHDFVIKNTTGLEVPSYYQPFDFSAYSQKLLKTWASLMLELHRLFETEDSFSVGFVFDEHAEAERENGKFGTVYYINPAVIVSQNNSNSRSLSKRWKFNSAGKFALLAVAVHEFAHRKYSYHDESYSNFLTDITGVVMRNLKSFHKCFR